MRAALIFSVVGSIVVVADIKSTLSPPFITGCDSTNAACTALNTATIASLSDLDTLGKTARECANSKSTCSVLLEVTSEVSGADICTGTNFGIKLGKLSTKWAMEPNLKLASPLTGACVPTGGFYSNDVDVCNGDAGTPIQVVPSYLSTMFAFSSTIGPNVAITGCTPEATAVVTATMSRSYIYGEGDDDENNNNEDNAGASTAAAPEPVITATPSNTDPDDGPATDIGGATTKAGEGKAASGAAKTLAISASAAIAALTVFGF